MPDPNPQSGERSTVIHPVSADEACGLPGAGMVDLPHAWGQWTHPEPGELSAQMEGCEVEQLLGRGGMGAVYRARQRALDRAVAIKLLPAELSTNAEFSGRFHREALAMASLDHPCIVKVLDFGKTRDGLLFYTMEFVDGGDLKRLLKEQGALPPRRAAEIVRDVCSALQCAHSRGILHRDIKPANILLTSDGRVRVADFGLARIAGGEPDSVTTMPGAVMGTPDYMAPEQSRGGDTDARADVYAAGVVLYQLLTGKLPQGAWELPSSLLADAEPDVTARLDAVVKKALQENVAARYASADAMRAALEEILPARAATGTRSAAPGPSALLCSALLMTGAAWLLLQTKVWRDVTTHVRAAVIGFAAPVEPAVAERIVLVDISRLKPKTQPGGGGEVNATPRDKLLALVTAIAAARPQAIGVDIDFSPPEDHPDKPYTPDDPAFFRELLRLQAETGIAIFTGVWRHDASGLGQWLGGAEFAPLAAGLGIAREEDDPVERLPLTLVSGHDGAALPSLSLALARAGGAAAPDDGAAAWFLRRITGPCEAGPVAVTEYTANFSALDTLIKGRVSGSTPEEIPGLREHLKGKLVLLSDADLSQRADPFTLPAHRNEPVPGGYVHACGTATLLSGTPAALTLAGRLFAGAGFIALLAGGFWFVERRVRQGRGRIKEKFARRAGRAAVLAGTAVLTILFMRLCRLAWTDVIYLSAGLVLLIPLAGRVQAVAKGISTAWRKGLYGSPRD